MKINKKIIILFIRNLKIILEDPFLKEEIVSVSAFNNESKDYVI